MQKYRVSMLVKGRDSENNVVHEIFHFEMKSTSQPTAAEAEVEAIKHCRITNPRGLLAFDMQNIQLVQD